MKGKYRLLSLLLCITVFFSFSVCFTFADSEDGRAEAKKAAVAGEVSGEAKTISGHTAAEARDYSAFAKDFNKQSAVDDNSMNDDIWWNENSGAADKFTLYKGQKLHMHFSIWDVWSDCYTIPLVVVFDEYDEALWAFNPEGDSYYVVNYNYPYHDVYNEYIDIASNDLPSGDYYVAIAGMPCDQYGYWLSNYSSISYPVEWIDFSIKKLPKPKSLKVTAGKKKVTISWKKSKGASKYQIYRSTKKNSGYKKIKTTSKKKFVDKKVKRGKRYYYKVRAIKGSSSTGKAYSKYTSPKRSKKVR